MARNIMNSISALSVRDAAPRAIPSAAAWTTSPGNSMYIALHYNTIQLLHIVVEYYSVCNSLYIIQCLATSQMIYSSSLSRVGSG